MNDLYLAPMEEITGYVYRNVLAMCFGGVDKYYTPFVTPNQNKIMKTKDGRELAIEHNKDKSVVIQMLTNDGDHFNDLAAFINELGYGEINLNCGCPSNTVVKKNKGSGILKDLDRLDRLLDQIFNGSKSVLRANPKMKISVKTRLGMIDDDEFMDVLKVYNRYPLSELIIHGRVQKDFYKGLSRLEPVKYAKETTNIPIVYNGDIFTLDDYRRVVEALGDIPIMIGRGAIRNPGLFRQIKTGREATKREVREFITKLYDTYAIEYSQVDAMCKLKEVWVYLSTMFDGIDEQLKWLRKAKEPAEYKAAVNAMPW